MSWDVCGLVDRKIIGSATRRLVLLTMASRANNDGTRVYASFGTMARDCELSRATVKRTIKEFEAEGLVKCVGVEPCENGETNDYTLNLKAIEALPNIRPKDPVQREPGSPRTGVTKETGVTVNPVQSENPVQGDPPTRVTVTPKPVHKPIQVVVSAPVGKDRIDALVDRLGAKANVAAGELRHGAVLNRLLRDGCDWFEDIEPAADALAASWNRRDGINSWKLIEERALRLRDTRLAPARPPQPVSEQPRRAGKVDSGAVIDRIFGAS